MKQGYILMEEVIKLERRLKMYNIASLSEEEVIPF